MSVAGVMRQHGLGDGFSPEAGRRVIEAYDVRFALARRPRVSWQTLGKMLGLNALDLQRACERSVVQPAAPKPVPQSLLALVAIWRGATGHVGVAAAIGSTDSEAGVIIARLKARGFLTGNPRACGWRLTDAGAAKAAAVSAKMAGGAR